jgi:hypothetical protein
MMAAAVLNSGFAETQQIIAGWDANQLSVGLLVMPQVPLTTRSCVELPIATFLAVMVSVAHNSIFVETRRIIVEMDVNRILVYAHLDQRAPEQAPVPVPVMDCAAQIMGMQFARMTNAVQELDFVGRLSPTAWIPRIVNLPMVVATQMLHLLVPQL